MIKPGQQLFALCAVVVIALGSSTAALSSDPPSVKVDPTTNPTREKKPATKRKNAGLKEAADRGGKRKATGANESEKPYPGQKAASVRPRRNLAAKGLKIIVKDATIEALPFEDFVDWVERKTGAEVAVRWRVLEGAGIGRTDLLTIQAKNVSIRGLLLIAFDQLTDNLEKPELAARADGNILTISTRRDLNAKMVARVYEIEDLLIVLPEISGVTIDAAADRSGRTRVSTQRQHGGGKTKEQVAQELIDVITTHLEPASWKSAGGKGTLRFFRGRLIVYNNLYVHQALAGAIGSRRG